MEVDRKWFIQHLAQCYNLRGGKGHLGYIEYPKTIISAFLPKSTHFEGL